MNIFVDYAAVDGNDHPKFAKFASECVVAGSHWGGTIVRAAWGTLPDLTVTRDWDRIRSGPLGTRGAYLYLTSGDRPVDQVHTYAEVMMGRLGVGDFPPIIDIEDRFPDAQTELAALHEAWLEMKRIYGVAPMLYDSGRVWHEDLGDLPAGEMRSSPQWVAKPWPWPVRTRAQLAPGPLLGDRYEPVVPAPWGPGNWWLHQYQGDALPCPGFTSTVDLSRFHLLAQGDRGSRVTWVQERIGAATDGIFGPETASRLRTFQRMWGLYPDAIVGPQTFAVLAWWPWLGRVTPLHAA